MRAFHIISDKLRLHESLDMIKKNMNYNSEVTVYVLSKEHIDTYLSSKYKNKFKKGTETLCK